MAATAGIVTWPAGVPYEPLREGLNLRPMDQFTAREMDGGWTDRESLFTVTPATYAWSRDLSLRQFEILKGWWLHTLGRGARTFLHQVWIGEAFVETEVRMASEPFQAAMPDGDRWIVSAQIEILDLPAPETSTLAAMQLAEILDDTTPLADLNDLVHVTYPAAVA